jgi:hypothetical protein
VPQSFSMVNFVSLIYVFFFSVWCVFIAS